jgi:hypothetical protein
MERAHYSEPIFERPSTLQMSERRFADG